MASSTNYVFVTIMIMTSLAVVRVGDAQDATRHAQEMLRRSLIQSADPESEVNTDDDAVAILLDQPLDLNAATVDQLVRIPGVTPPLARLIVSHRQRYGDFASTDSLTTVFGISGNDAELVAPFVFVEHMPTSHRNPLQLRLSHMMQGRLDEGKGFSRSASDSVTRYLGGPIGWTTRFAAETESFVATATADHDRGEPWQWRPSGRRFGADLISWSVEVKPGGRILRSIVIGDIRYSSRMGLAAGANGFASFERPSRAASYSPPRGYSGTGSSSSGRGVAVRLETGPIEVATIASRGRRDARHEITTAGDSILVMSSSDRNHRTDAELERRNLLGLRFVAVRVGVTGDRIDIGLSAQNTSFDKAVSRVDRPDQLFAFAGQSQSTLGVDLSWHSGRTRCTAEAIWPAQSKLTLDSFSSACFCEVSPGGSYRVWTYVRILSRSSGSLAGAPLSRASGPSAGEQGISFGVRSRPARGLAVTIYADLWRHPWLRFNLWRPSGGREVGLRLTRKTKRSAHSIKISQVSKDSGATTVDSVGRSIRSAERITRTVLSLSSSWWLDPRLGVLLASDLRRARGQELSSAVGTLLSVGARVRHRRLQLSTGVALFESPSAATRIYAYEPSMRFGFGAVSYTGSGERWYVLLSATVAHAVLVQMKYSSTSRYGARTVGSGLDEVQGNRIRDVGFQIVVNTSGKS
ncbi:MAG: helix-hairpin-helix domain-containing protein [Rhodothermia bacterium]|nr:helix-hairpin-helix domain-containing protein [Rhodothermia bacterium]